MSCSFNFRIGRSTVSNIVRDTCEAIWVKLCPLYLKTPSSEEDWLEISNEFMREWNFPHVIGAVDGKHAWNVHRMEAHSIITTNIFTALF